MKKKIFLFFLSALVLTLIIIFSAVNRRNSETGNPALKKYESALELLGNKQYKQSIQSLQEIIEQDSSFCRAYLKLIVAFKAQNQLPKVQKYLENLRTLYPDNAGVYYGIGLLEKEKGDTLRAIKNFKQSIERGNRCAYVFTSLVSVLDNKNYDNMIVYLDSLVRSGQHRGTIYYGLGLILAEKKELNKAIQALEKSVKLEPQCLPAYLEKSSIYYNEGKLQKALDIQAVGYKKSVRIGDLEMQSRFLGERGRILTLTGKPRQAMKSFKNALAIAERFGDRKSKERYLGNIGAIYAGIAEYPQALEYYSKAIAIAREFGDKRNEIILLSNSGVVLRNSGRFQESLEKHKKALNIAQEIKDEKLASLNIGNIGTIYFYRSQFTNALNNYEKAIEIDRKIRDKTHLGTWFLNSGLCYWRINNYSKAQINFERALPVLKEIGNKSEGGRAFNAFGTMYWSLGNYSQALDYLQKALIIAREIGDRASESRSLSMIGNVNVELGNYQKALQYTEQAAQIAEKIGAKYQLAIYLGNMGASHHSLGHRDKALEYYNRSLQIEREIGDLNNQSVFLGDIGLLQMEMGKFKDAQKTLENSLKIARQIQSKDIEAKQLLNLGNLSFLQGHPKDAVQLLTQALKISESIHEVPSIWMSHSLLARVYKQQGNYSDARRHLLAAIELIENVRSSLLLSENRSTFQSINLNVYEQLIDILYILHGTESKDKFGKAAFSYAERAKARGMLEMLYSGKMFHRLKDIPLDLRNQIIDVESQIEAKHAASEEESNKSEKQPDQSKIVKIESEISSLERKKAHLLQEIETKHPEFYQLEHPAILSAAEIKGKLLNDHQLLIEYFVASEKIYCWIFTAEGMDFKAIELSRQELKRRLARISPLFDHDKKVENVAIDHKWANIQVDLLHDLYQTLIADVLDDTLLQQKTDLIIVPDDVLFFFPFELLVTEYSKKDVRYLIEDHPISYIPAVSLLNPKLRNKKTAQNDLLAFGNPDFGGMKKDGFLNRIASLLPGNSELRNQEFVQLPFAENEAKTIARHFERSITFTGKNATEANFKKYAPDYKLIHLATHYIADDQQPLYSKIVFARGEKDGEDGYLQTYEIFNLKLHADLVALSGCNSGLGKLRRGEGIVGLSRAFLYAGASSLLVSLWQVQDESTAELMTKFYTNLRAGMNKSRALQQAKIDMIHAKDWKQNPFYWGPFILIGDWENGLD
ncbi:MAG: CHAT domain-containing protein [Actinobacteria bacterium]|nr:CHAT domain-containing protein [Actinomycetota bacterium]